MTSQKRYFFRRYICALLFSMFLTKLVDKSLTFTEIKKTLLVAYPNWFACLLDSFIYVSLSFSFFILGCFFVKTLSKLWEKSQTNKHVEALNVHSIVFQKLVYITLFILVCFAVFYPFLDLISQSYEHNFSLGDALESVFSGIFLAVLFFLLREKIFGYPDLNDQWYLKSVTEKSAYNPYKGMELHHQLFLVQDKSKIKGTAEKYYEDSSIGKKGDHILHYSAGNRRRAYIEGTIQKNYFGPDILILHAIEEGEKRQSTIYCRIELKRKWLIGDYDFSKKGQFYSMVSSQEGYVVLSKTIFERKEHSIDEKFLQKKIKINEKPLHLKLLTFIRAIK